MKKRKTDSKYLTRDYQFFVVYLRYHHPAYSIADYKAWWSIPDAELRNMNRIPPRNNVRSGALWGLEEYSTLVLAIAEDWEPMRFARHTSRTMGAYTVRLQQLGVRYSDGQVALWHNALECAVGKSETCGSSFYSMWTELIRRMQRIGWVRYGAVWVAPVRRAAQVRLR